VLVSCDCVFLLQLQLSRLLAPSVRPEAAWDYVVQGEKRHSLDDEEGPE
jgi:hypothetical protein